MRGFYVGMAVLLMIATITPHALNPSPSLTALLAIGAAIYAGLAAREST